MLNKFKKLSIVFLLAFSIIFGFFATNVDKAHAAPVPSVSDSLVSGCESSAPLSFVTCPIFEKLIANPIAAIIGGTGDSGARKGLLVSFLEFSPLSNKDGTGNAIKSIVGSIITIANAFYVVIFLILIFSSSLPFGLDNYTIKKTLPRFIGAVIMTQFAYVICGVTVDFFNALGNLVPNIIFALPNFNQYGSSISGSGLAGLGVGLGSTFGLGFAAAGLGGAGLAIGFGILFIIALVALVALIVGFVYMVLRYLVLFILIIISPLAFASWVLPGTDKFFTTWWKNFIRLNAMYPIITGMIAASIVLSSILITDKNTNAAIKLVALLIPVVALLAIPRTLKWTTDGMNALAGKMLGGTAGKIGAGGQAVTKAGKAAAKQGMQMGKTSAINFGKTRAAEKNLLPGAAMNAREFQAGVGRQQEKTKAGLANLNRAGLRQSSVGAMQAFAKKRTASTTGAARAHIDNLLESQDGVGLAQALATFTEAGRAAGKSDTEIAAAWNDDLLSGGGRGANIPKAKTMSPVLFPEYDGSNLSNVKVSMQGNDYNNVKFDPTAGDFTQSHKGVGAAKIAELDKDILEAHNIAGKTANSLGFNQSAAEEALSSDTVKWANPEAKEVFGEMVERSYASGEWARPTATNGGSTNGDASSAGGASSAAGTFDALDALDENLHRGGVDPSHFPENPADYYGIDDE